MNDVIKTDNDFDQLSWHDSTVYSINFPDLNDNMKFDLDYIIEWIKEENRSYKFILAPAILCFENVFNLSIKLTFEDYTELSINEIKRSNKRLLPNGKVYVWDFFMLLDRGNIEFSSSGFRQHFTDIPQLSSDQKYDRKNILNL